MTISTSTNRYSYAGNGVTTAFAYSSRFLADGDLVVSLVVDATGVSTTQTLTTHYTISGAGDAGGGTVTMVTAPATGETLVIYGDPAITQAVDLVENDPLPAETLETAYDRLTLIAQRLKDQITRSFRLADSDTVSNPVLPLPAAGQVFGWNSAGTAIVNYILATGTSLIDLIAPSGSSLVGFLQAGAGAGPRTGQSKMRDIVSVTDFYANGVSGALVDPTGAVESTAGIQAADVAGTVVYFPAGIYKVATTASLTMGQATAGDKMWKGAGQNKSVLTAAGANTILKNNFACTNIVIEDLGFNGNSIAPSCISLGDGASGVGGITLDRVWASSATTLNIELKHVSYSTLRGCYSRYCEFAGVGQGISIGNGSTFIDLEDCQFLALGQSLVILGGSSAIRSTNCDFYSSATPNASANLVVIQDSNHVWFKGCSFEPLMVFTNALVRIKAPSAGGLFTSDVTFEDCYNNGLPYAHDLFYLENGIYNVKFAGCRAIPPNGGKMIVNNNAVGALVSADKCIALANYTDTAQTPWSVGNCSNAASCAIAFNGGFAGQSIASFGGAGLINWQVNSGGIGNAADVTDDTLFIYTLPAKAMLLDGQRVTVRAAVSTAANGNNKTFKIFFGNNAVISSGVITANAKNGYIEAEITRLSSTAICAVGSYVTDGQAPVVTVTTTAAVLDLLANTIDVRVTGASPTTAAANDCNAYSMRVNFEN